MRLCMSRPAHRGRLRRRARVGAGCGVRARLVTARPGGARATPPSRHYERDLRTQSGEPEDNAASGNVRRKRPGGLGAKKPPRWSAERRASPGCADCESRSARGCEAQRSAPAGLRHWPAKGASQAPGRLSALRPLTLCERELGKPRRRIRLARALTLARSLAVTLRCEP
jgi:hypothetical protein